jgi:diguanylate cyclase (GGDEF)-like protein
MDVLTAGAALIVVQLCVSLLMAGIFTAAPSEKCTRYWALSGLAIAAGVLMVIVNAGAPRFAILIIGNNALILGIVLQWCGIRAFFRKRQGWIGWAIALAFFLAYNGLLLAGASVDQRALLSAVAILAMLFVNTYEVWIGHGPRRSFARMLTLGALLLLITSYGFRVFATAFQIAELLPSSSNPMAITLLYFIPIIGTLLLSNGLLLLYFERVVAHQRHLATHDDLTGLLNRRATVTGGERELVVATRMRSPVTVAFADIDHFKQINDTLGHEAGDSVIVEIASKLAETCRSMDLIGRYGGEEFCIVLPGVDSDAAAIVGERLVQAVAGHTFSIGRPVTISVGLASLSSADTERGWGALIQRADKVLYEAKQAGRNRFRINRGDKVPQESFG